MGGEQGKYEAVVGVPEYLERFRKEYLQPALQAGWTTPAAQYPGQLTAGYDPLQLMAGQLMSNLFGKTYGTQAGATTTAPVPMPNLFQNPMLQSLFTVPFKPIPIGPTPTVEPGPEPEVEPGPEPKVGPAGPTAEPGVGPWPSAMVVPTVGPEPMPTVSPMVSPAGPEPEGPGPGAEPKVGPAEPGIEPYPGPGLYPGPPGPPEPVPGPYPEPYPGPYAEPYPGPGPEVTVGPVGPVGPAGPAGPGVSAYAGIGPEAGVGDISLRYPSIWNIGEQALTQNILAGGAPVSVQPTVQAAWQQTMRELERRLAGERETAGITGTLYSTPFEEAKSRAVLDAMSQWGLSAAEMERQSQEAARQRLLTATGQAAGLGGMLAQYPLSVAQQAMGMGAGMQATQQAGLERTYQDWLRQLQLTPQQQAAYQYGMGFPPATTTYQPGMGDFMSQLLGGGMAMLPFLLSSRRFKTNIKPIAGALEKIRKLEAVEFNWKDSTEARTEFGFIAEELEKVLPEVVLSYKGEAVAVKYISIVPLLAQAIKEQQAQIEKLKRKLNN